MKIKGTAIREYYAAVAVFAAFLCLSYPNAAKNGVLNGMEVCFGTVIPSVFPMLVLSSFVAKTDLPPGLRRLLHRPLLFAFGLGGECSAAVFTGLCGGYNAGTKNACSLYDEGVISASEAQRLALFFTCPGLSFCINVAGIAFMHSQTAGVFLFLSEIFACCTCAFVFNLFDKAKKRTFDGRRNEVSFSEAAVFSVKTSSSSLISISAWITVFAVMSAVLSEITKNRYIGIFFKLTGEITTSLFFTSKNCSICVTAACLFFGGWCIFLQQLPFLEKLSVNPAVFLVSRIAGAAAAGIYQHIFTKIFSFCIPASTAAAEIKIFSHNPQGGIALLILCTVFLTFVSDSLIYDKSQHKKSRIYNNRTCPADHNVLK